jgi:transposase
VASGDLARSPGHPFYDRLNKLLIENEFDRFVEDRCREFYASNKGRPSMPPGVYFRLLMVGYFEGIGSERAIAWRCADSRSLSSFLGYEPTETTPNHSTLSRTRRLLDLETHGDVFTWILTLLEKHGLLKGKTISIDGSTLEANAAMRSIVRRDNGQTYDDFLEGLAKESGIETPTCEQKAKIDRKRKKKGSNDEWKHPGDPDAKITKMKDGRTHLAHKIEHATDLDTTAIVAVTIQPANRGDTQSVHETLCSRIRGDRGQRLRKLRGEINERSFAHCLETGGGRRAHVRRQDNVAKRALIGGATYNLGLLMRTLTGIGTPKGLQGRFAEVLDRMRSQLAGIRRLMNAIAASRAQVARISERIFVRFGSYAAA